MIIYRDILNGNELLSDTYKIKDVGGGLWEADTKMVKKGAENFVLEGANPSAEGEDADEGGEGGDNQPVLEIADQFRLTKMDNGMSKKSYQAETKKYLKAVVEKLKELGKPEEEIKAFQTDAATGFKKIVANFDNYDIYQGESENADGMLVLVDFREDGITPYVTLWKGGLEEYKV